MSETKTRSRRHSCCQPDLLYLDQKPQEIVKDLFYFDPYCWSLSMFQSFDFMSLEVEIFVISMISGKSFAYETDNYTDLPIWEIRCQLTGGFLLFYKHFPVDFISSGQKLIRERVAGINLCSWFRGRHCGNTSMFSCCLSVGWNKGGVFYLEFLVKFISLADWWRNSHWWSLLSNWCLEM